MTEATPSSPGSLSRRTFVGREAQLGQLRTAFDQADAGEGSLVMVVGEPGIGKTALCEQLADHVAGRGGRTLVGHCYEEGSLSLPYLAFVEVMRSLVLGQEPDRLAQELGTGAGLIARIVPEVRERIAVELAPPGDPEEDRYRLMLAVSDFLRNSAASMPMLVVLEDLHDADRGTLDLLNHLARNLSGSRLLVAGTYRDVEVDRAHPLSAALAELRRVYDFGRLALRGLSPDEVHRMINKMSGQEVRWSLAEAVHRQTEGNPLFVHEVVRYLAEEGLLERREGELRRAGDEPLASKIPEGLRDVIGKRMSRLSDDCNSILSVASVIGRDFRLDVLERVSDVHEERLHAALQEASSAAVIEQRAILGAGAVFRFAHAFFRQTLYDEMYVPRRIRLHQQVGRALEEVYGERLEGHAAEIAEHFSQSTERTDLTKALSYGKMAASQAMEVFAYGEAARQLEQALKAQEVLEPEGYDTRCDLLLALGDALLPLGEPRRVTETIAEEAYALTERLRQDLPDEVGDRAARVCRLALEALHRAMLARAPMSEDWPRWAERLDLHASPGTSDRAYADVALARLKLVEGRYEEGVRLVRLALETARGTGDREMLLTAAWQAINVLTTTQHWQEAVPLAEEFVVGSREGVRARTVGQIGEFCGVAFCAIADRDNAELAWRQLFEVADRSKDAFTVLNAMSFRGVLATMDGRLEEALQYGSDLVAKGEELGMPMIGLGMSSRASGRAHFYLGSTFGSAREASFAGQPGAGGEFIPILMDRLDDWVDQVVGSPSYETQASLGARLDYILASDTGSHPFVHAGLVAVALEAAVHLGDAEAAARLIPVAETGPPGTDPRGVAGCNARVVAGARALLGGPGQARDWYQQAIDACTKLRHRPELALTRFELAELLLDHYPDEKDEAFGHLDFAIAEFGEMKMQPSLEDALALHERLTAKPAKAPRYPDGLTEREAEVLRLVAMGKTDREIAEAIFIATRTASTHVSNILSKIGAANRTEAASYANRHGLV